jgi:hypothetical protein
MVWPYPHARPAPSCAPQGACACPHTRTPIRCECLTSHVRPFSQTPHTAPQQLQDKPLLSGATAAPRGYHGGEGGSGGDGVTLTLSNVSYDVKVKGGTKSVLHDVSAVARPGEVCVGTVVRNTSPTFSGSGCVLGERCAW